MRLREGNQSWSEPPILDFDPFESDEIMHLGYMALPEEKVKGNPPMDTILADEAIQTLTKLENLESKQPFFLGVGFR